jgi:putative ABC transport system permease protein
MQMFGLFAGASLLLAGVGIYALLAFTVRQRTAEIGLRMALGARSGEILGLVMKQGVILLLLGWVAGLPCTFLATRWVAGLLYGVAPTDWAAFVAASSVMAAAILVGCAIPAIRALRIDPTEALRCE